MKLFIDKNIDLDVLLDIGFYLDVQDGRYKYTHWDTGKVSSIYVNSWNRKVSINIISGLFYSDRDDDMPSIEVKLFEMFLNNYIISDYEKVTT